MSDDEDDYLSDKFLSEETTSKSGTKTYSDLRKEAQKRSQLKNELNRTKTQRESRQEAMSRSLFEVEKEKEEAGLGSRNKALAMMIKMGFKPGESLGKRDDEADPEASASTSTTAAASPSVPEVVAEEEAPRRTTGHLVEPIAINEWAGKKGIGSGGTKRALSPGASERDSEKLDFRQRSRLEYNVKRAEGRLGPAQRTCATLDENAGKEFNMMTTQLEKKSARIQDWPIETLEEAAQFLHLQIGSSSFFRILRTRYHYCFWCGSQYDNKEELDAQCPGPGEDDHD
ncbi:hypothetical protein DL96DRAFT_1694469 [Flagelloscypha sp. PMI_526]|nr:hypothetical protein DL96DRAFT_1694469 [Flagelloscypha sp. PMI_526]